MLAVSTSWQSPLAASGSELLNNITELGVDSVELEYRITPRMFEEMLPLLKNGGPAAVSIHNFFPALQDIGRGGHALQFSADDPAERELAIKYTGRAIDIAAELEAKAVVLHLGKTNADPRMDTLRQLYDQGQIGSDLAAATIEMVRADREVDATRSLDRVLFCLEELNEMAERRDVLLGLENRYYPHEIPNAKDLDIIFMEFPGSRLRYWHDIGHAVVQENLGLAGQTELLEGRTGVLAGVHLHDVKGYDDHLAPGSGDVDFGLLKPYLTDGVIKVVEVQPSVTADELRAGLDFLAEAGLA